jgi:hypothetical protein
MDALTQLLSLLTESEKTAIRNAIAEEDEEGAKTALLQAAADRNMRQKIWIFFGKNFYRIGELQQQIAEAVKE